MINHFSNKKILVTGGSGFVGTNLIDKLLQIGASVRATIHKKQPIIQSKNIEYIKCDLLDKKSCDQIVKDCDYVFHCAAISAGAEMMAKRPLFLLNPNIIMSLYLLESAHEHNIEKFIFISSSTIYPLTNHAIKEDESGIEFYEKYFISGWMKKFLESVCEMYSTKIDNPLTTIVVRPSNLYGPHDKFDKKRSKVIPALIRRALEKEDPYIVWGDGNDFKDFIFIDDFVDGLLLAAEKINKFDPINIASGDPVTIRKIIKNVLIATSYSDAKIVFDTSKPTMIPKRILNITKAKNMIGFQPKIDLPTGIKKTISWYSEYFGQEEPELQ